MTEKFDKERIISALCSAALNADGWQAAIDAAAEATNSAGAILLPIRGNLPVVALSESLRKASESYFKDGWYERDLRYRATNILIDRGVATDADVASEEEMRKLPYYQDFIFRHELNGWAGVRIGRGANVWCLSIQRTTGQDPFDADELECLRSAAQSLDVVSELASTLAFTSAESALTAFEFASKATILLDRRGQIVRVNSAAEKLFDDDVKIVNRRLHCSHKDSTARLDQALKRLLWSVDTTAVPPIALHRRDRKPLLTYLMRAQGLADSPLSSSHAIVVLVDPEKQASLSIETLRITFGLTNSEARLAAALATGADLGTLASQFALSRDTLRNQLKAIFGKTGARRQAELVAMLSHLLEFDAKRLDAKSLDAKSLDAKRVPAEFAPETQVARKGNR